MLGFEAIQVTEGAGGRHLRVALAAPPGNILDRAMMAELEAVIEERATRRAAPALRCLTLGSSGPHFSYGASIQEHLPGAVEVMLPRMHRLCRRLVDLDVFTIACVRGFCLGGGLELALTADRIVCNAEACLGQPEVDLGVFAPIASALLPLRTGDGRAVGLLASGRRIDASEAKGLGIVDEIAVDPEAAALAWAQAHLFAKSAVALRFSVRAARRSRKRALDHDLPELERLYLEELMATHDASEGLNAFLEKRAPVFRDA